MRKCSQKKADTRGRLIFFFVVVSLCRWQKVELLNNLLEMTVTVSPLSCAISSLQFSSSEACIVLHFHEIYTQLVYSREFRLQFHLRYEYTFFPDTYLRDRQGDSTNREVLVNHIPI